MIIDIKCSIKYGNYQPTFLKLWGLSDISIVNPKANAQYTMNIGVEIKKT